MIIYIAIFVYILYSVVYFSELWLIIGESYKGKNVERNF